MTQLRENELSLRMDGNRLVGEAILYNKKSTMIEENGERFREIVEPGAFDLSGNVHFNYRHEEVAQYGDTKSGNLVLTDTPRALEYSLELPSYVTTLREMVQAGKFKGISVGMQITEQTIDPDGTHRVHKAILEHLAIAKYPAYASSVRLREAKSLHAKMRHDLLRILIS